MSTTPKIQVRIFEEKHWISLDDHKTDVQRYKSAVISLEKTISSQSLKIISLQEMLLEKNKSPVESVMESLFGDKKK